MGFPDWRDILYQMSIIDQLTLFRGSEVVPIIERIAHKIRKIFSSNTKSGLYMYMQERDVIDEFNLESLQIYFQCSLEIQEELLQYGYEVPGETPIPHIYGDYSEFDIRYQLEGLQKSAFLDPTLYNESIETMGWKRVGNRNYLVPPEQGAKLEISTFENNDGKQVKLSIIFEGDPPHHHLEKISYRTIPPRKWVNWAMMYVNFDEVMEAFEGYSIDFSELRDSCKSSYKIVREKKQDGAEDAYYFQENGQIGIRNESHSLCLGCFQYIDQYLADGDTFSKVRLRINSSDIPSYSKIGIVKIEGKDPQLMIKLVSSREHTKSIIASNGDEKTGKARGQVVPCDHHINNQEITLNYSKFFRALCALDMFKRNERSCPHHGTTCYTGRPRRATWLA